MTSVNALATPRRRASSGVFVGRRHELGLVDAAWKDARAGEPRVVWVDGAAGAGKTALLGRCVARHGSGAVLSGAGDEAETSLPHGLLDQLVAGLPSGASDRFALLRPDRDPRTDPLAVGADLLAALDELADAGGPLLVLVDDVQWADAASVAVLAFVLRRLRHDRVLVLVGHRVPDSEDAVAPDAEAPCARLLAAGRDAVRRVRLDGLDTAEVSELAAALGRPLGSTGAAERLRRHTQGHPLSVRTLLEELPPEVLSATADVLPAPRPLQAVVLVRLSRIPLSAQALVVAASVLGEACPLSLAVAVAGLEGTGEAADALDAAVAAGLVEERGDHAPAWIAFAHPLVRAAVHGDLGPARRRELHAAAARLLAGRAALDHRLAAAAGPDPGLAAEVEAFCVDGSVELPAVEAADLLLAAADLDPVPAARERRQAAAIARLLRSGEIARAATMEPIVDGWRPGPARSAVLGQLALLSGRFGRARERLEAAVGGAEPDGDVHAVATAHLALLHVVEGEPARAVDRAGAALRTPAGRSAAVRLPGGMALVLGLAATGQRAAAHAVLDAAASTSGPAPSIDVLLARGVLDALAGDDPSAERHLLGAVRRARAGEPARAPALAMAFLPAVQDRLGSGEGPDALVEDAELAVALARDGGTALPGTLARAFAAESLAVRGRADEARAHLRAAHADGPHWWGGAVCLAVAGAVLAECGDAPAGMLDALGPALEPPVRALTDGLGMLAPRVLQIDALVALERRDEARSALAELDARLGAGPPSRHHLDAARLRLVLGSGPVAGPRSVSDLGAGLDEVRAPLARARLETEIGRALVGAGERRAGVDLLRTARDRMTRVGAVGWRRRCEELLHDAGLTPSGTDEALGLTSHEHAVAALVAQGLTNREVGRRLFVTPRTVAYHLSNIYAKLGVASRRELRARIDALVPT